MTTSTWTLRFGRPLAVGLTAVLAVGAIVELLQVNAARPALLASDVVKGYLPGAQRYLETGSPYTPAQVAGPWVLGYHSFIHPPTALALFVPYLVLPLPLWWILPIAIICAALWHLRPATWTWPIMAACLVWPRSTGAILTGNSDIWAATAVAAGAAWGWPIALLAIKPTFAPLGLVAVRQPSLWIGVILALAVVVLTLTLWPDWFAVIQNAGLPLSYSLLNLPLVLAPAVAYLGRTRQRDH